MPSLWLLKTEPSAYSLDDLARAPDQTTCWDGIRNAEARNFMRDRFAVGDRAFLYHSNADPSAIVAIVAIVGGARPDPTQFEPTDVHFDPKSTRAAPTWCMVDVKLVERLVQPVTLAQVKADPLLQKMGLVTRSRLSVTPVTPAEWKRVLQWANGKAKDPAAGAAARAPASRSRR
ncbi:MAG: EVE domain-containing protein [Planctomycetes bacterium]|nr:EVE domain-containing protein [Planctomycetota bacterium]